MLLEKGIKMSRATFVVGFIAISLFYIIIAPAQAYESTPTGWASYNTVANPDPCFSPNLNGTTGGAGGPTVTVSNEANFAKYASSTTPGPYIVQVQGTINLTTARVDISPNKTIIGIGTDPTINGPYNLRVRGENTSGDLLGYNVIIRNLIIKNITSQDKDGVTIQDKAHHVWVDHCTISACTDEAIGISHMSDYITVSWCHFYNQDKVALLGHTSDNYEDVNHFKVTYHHNFFDETLQRHPRVRFSFLCHVYNNYYNGVPSTQYGIASTCEAYVMAEGNYFKNMTHPMFSIAYSDDRDGWLIERDNIYDNSGDPEVNPPESMPEPSTYYSYTLDDAEDIPTMVSLGAGVDGLDFFPHWLFGPYGDFDRNGTVDMKDLKQFVDSYWLNEDIEQIADADYNGDGIVNFYEFALLAGNWRQGP
jgi:pectate lyase